MATVRTVVNGAFQDAGLYGTGETPTDDDADIALELLKSLFRHLSVAGTLGRLQSRLVSASYTAGENERVGYLSGTPTITKPTSVEAEEDPGIDGVDTSNRLPRHLSQVETAKATPDLQIYDAIINAWVSVDGLTLDSACPLGLSHRYGLQALLAVRLCPRFQVPIPPGVENEAIAGKMALSLNWHGAQLPTQTEYF